MIIISGTPSVTNYLLTHNNNYTSLTLGQVEKMAQESQSEFDLIIDEAKNQSDQLQRFPALHTAFNGGTFKAWYRDPDYGDTNELVFEDNPTNEVGNLFQAINAANREWHDADLSGDARVTISNNDITITIDGHGIQVSADSHDLEDYIISVIENGYF